MYENLIGQLIQENVATGFMRGQEMFVNEINESIEKQHIYESVNVHDVMRYLLEDYQQRHSC